MIFKKHSVAVTKEDVEKDEIFSTVNIFTFFFSLREFFFFLFFLDGRNGLIAINQTGKGGGHWPLAIQIPLHGDERKRDDKEKRIRPISLSEIRSA